MARGKQKGNVQLQHASDCIIFHIAERKSQDSTVAVIDAVDSEEPAQ